MWPAFWMMPTDSVYGGWAASGEIDIMETKNDTDYIGGTLHYGDNWPNNASTGGNYSPGGVNFSDAFHVYTIEWEPDVMRWYVDGILYSTKTNSQWYTNAAPGNSRAPFDQDFYIIINAAVGGNYTGCTSSSCIPGRHHELVSRSSRLSRVRVCFRSNAPRQSRRCSPTKAYHRTPSSCFR